MEFRAIGSEEFPSGWITQKHAKHGKLSGLAALRYTISWLEELAAILLRDAPEAPKEEGVEALLVDQASPD